MAPTVDPETLEAARAYLWHARHRGSCHNAQGPRCECQCGAHYHQAGQDFFALSTIPPEILVELRAEAAPATKGTARTPGPRRVRRNTAQLRMLLVQ